MRNTFNLSFNLLSVIFSCYLSFYLLSVIFSCDLSCLAVMFDKPGPLRGDIRSSKDRLWEHQKSWPADYKPDGMGRSGELRAQASIQGGGVLRTHSIENTAVAGTSRHKAKQHW